MKENRWILINTTTKFVNTNKNSRALKNKCRIIQILLLFNNFFFNSASY